MFEKLDIQGATKGSIGKGVQLKARKRLMRLKDAAEYMSMSTWKIRTLAHGGDLPYIQDGEGPILIDERDLDEYIERHKHIAPKW